MDRRKHEDKMVLKLFFQTFVFFLVVALWLLVTAPLKQVRVKYELLVL